MHCGLDDAIVIPDEKATLAHLRETFNKTLPGLTKPGDTVVIFWSGHGDVIPVDGKLEHFLIPYDTPEIKLPEKPSREQIQSAIDTLKRTTLTASVLQRWLQDLDGRRIVLIVEACFAGGLHEKGNPGRGFKGLGRVER